MLSSRVSCHGIHSNSKNLLNFAVFFSSCGPIFGAGADLLISNNCNTNKDSYSNLPHSYDGPNGSYETLFGDYNFSIADYEVFTTV